MSNKEMPGQQAVPEDYPQGFGVHWQCQRSFRLGNHDFDLTASFSDFLTADQVLDADRLFLYKTPALVGRYMDLAREQKPDTLVELGIFRGGSVAFLHLLLQPARMLALELEKERAEILDRFIRFEGVDETLRVEYGVDQADASRVDALATQHLGAGRCIDLVIDDASHLLAPTRASFETLFPRLRAGGSYIIEDFAVTQIATAAFLGDALAGSDVAQKCLSHFMSIGLEPDKKPLTLLAVEAMLAAIVAPGLIEKVIVDREWLRIIRGPDDIDAPRTFELRALAQDHFGLLQTSVSETLGQFLP